jgi:hypothetical protein
MPSTSKSEPAKTERDGYNLPADKNTRVVRVELPLHVANLLEAEANAEDRPMSLQAARIIRQYFEAQPVNHD